MSNSRLAVAASGSKEFHLGILNAVPSEFFIEGEKSDPQKFVDLFDAIGAPISYSIYDITRNHFPSRLGECDAYLITGSPCSVYESLEWIPTAENFIRDTFENDIPTVGICFGHQLIAQSLGGKVRRSEVGWLLGLTDIKFSSSGSVAQPSLSQTSLYFINRDQVVELPPGVEHLAGCVECPNAAFGVDRKLLSIQGHPEQPHSSMLTFVKVLRDMELLDDAAVQSAHDSMSLRQPNANLVAQWIYDFLASALSTRRI